MFSEGIQAGEGRYSRGWGRGGGQGVTQGQHLHFRVFGGWWWLEGGVSVAGSLRGCGLWTGCCSWRTGGEWAQAEWIRLQSQAFFLGPERSQPTKVPPYRSRMLSLWDFRASSQLKFPGILIGLQIDDLETKGEIFRWKLCGS